MPTLNLTIPTKFYVGELFTLPNVDGNLTPIGAMLLILTALILGTIFDSELLQGGMQDSRKTLNVQAVTTNPGSCHFWRWLQRRAEQKACSKGKPKRAKVHRVVVPMAKPGSAYKGGAVCGSSAVHLELMKITTFRLCPTSMCTAFVFPSHFSFSQCFRVEASSCSVSIANRPRDC